MPPKRARAAPAAMHDKMASLLKNVSRESALRIVSNLSNKCPLGVDAGKRGSLLTQVAEYKTYHPDKVLLLRVGEMYEAFGVDAALVIDSYAGCEPKGGEARVSIHSSRIQHVLDALVRRNITAVVYEESEVLCTPRHRFVSQIVSAATPLYGVDTGDTPSPLRIVGIMMHADATASLGLVDVQAKICQRLEKVSQTRAAAILFGSRIHRPIYVLRNVPKWLRHEDIVILGASPYADVCERILQEVETQLCVKKEAVRVVPIEPARCAPLPCFTLQQLGLKHELGIPSLVEHCLTRHAPFSIRRCMLDWLSAPPPEEVAESNRCILRKVCKENVTIGLRIGIVGRASRGVESLNIDAGTLRELRHNALSIKNSDIDTEKLLRATAPQWGIDFHTVEYDGVIRAIDDFLTETAWTVQDIRGSAFNHTLHGHSSYLKLQSDALDNANEKLSAIIAHKHEGELLRDSRGIAFRGRVDDTKLPVYDRNHRIVPNVFTTLALKDAEQNVAIAARALLDADQHNIEICTRKLQELLPTIRAIEALTLHISTLIEHARFATAHQWCIPIASQTDALELTGMRPYWLNNAVLNSVKLEQGNIVILTAPNGGGKTTLLRATASCVLLHQCGLSVPCEHAIVPNVDAIFLRCGSLDATLERRSSFANEMTDLRTIINAPGTVFAFVDEPCRGTSSTDGIALLTAVLENLPSSMTTIVSTHYHELVLKTERSRSWQLDAEVVDDDCRPRFSLTEGACQNSLALHVALAVGLPVNIVRSARRSEDIETLLLANLYANDVVFERVGPLHSVGGLHSTLYVLDTVEGVYVGESDNVIQRLQQHERSKPTIRRFFVARCRDKTHARSLEAALLTDLKFHDVVLLSVHDARA